MILDEPERLLESDGIRRYCALIYALADGVSSFFGGLYKALWKDLHGILDKYLKRKSQN